MTDRIEEARKALSNELAAAGAWRTPDLTRRIESLIDAKLAPAAPSPSQGVLPGAVPCATCKHAALLHAYSQCWATEACLCTRFAAPVEPPPERKGQPDPLPEVLPAGTRIACEDVVARKPVRLIEVRGEMVYFGDWGIRDGEHAPEGFWRPGDIDWDHWRSTPAAQTSLDAGSAAGSKEHTASHSDSANRRATQGAPTVAEPVHQEPSEAGKGEVGGPTDEERSKIERRGSGSRHSPYEWKVKR